MKAKHALCSVAVLSLLVPMGASTVLAGDGDVPIWVHQIMVTYARRSHWGPDAIVALVHIRDDDLNKIAGATVSAQ